MANDTEKMSQDEIDLLIRKMLVSESNTEQSTERSNTQEKAKEIIGKDNIYICIYCKRKRVYNNKWSAPIILCNGRGNCLSECGHFFMSWAHLESLKI